MIGVLGESFYKVNDKRFSCLRLSQDNIEEALRGLGLSILEFNLLPAEDREGNSVSDFEAVFHLVARKPSEWQIKQEFIQQQNQNKSLFIAYDFSAC